MLNRNLLIKPRATIKDALKQLSKTGERCLVVVDKHDSLLGTLTDGDVRRVILKGKFLKNKIYNIYEKKPTFLEKKNYSLSKIKNLFVKKNLDVIPIIDSSKKVIDLAIFTKLFKLCRSISNKSGGSITTDSLLLIR